MKFGLLLSALCLVPLTGTANALECRWDGRAWVCPQPPPQPLHEPGWGWGEQRRWQERHWEHEWRHREWCERHPWECR